MNSVAVALLAIALAGHLQPSWCVGRQVNLHFCAGGKTVSVQTFAGMGEDNSCKCMTGEAKDPTARSDYTQEPGMGSYKLHSEAKNWNEARKACMEEKAHLAIINSKEEQQALLKMLKDSESEIDGAKDKREAWLGMHDWFKEGEWVTVQGESLESTGYTEWSKISGGQPSNNGKNSNCGAIVKDDGGLDDLPCGDNYAFICELMSPCEGYSVESKPKK